MQKFKQNYSKCPNVRLHAVHMLNHALRRHIQRRADIQIEKVLARLKLGLLVGVFRKPKIGYFAHSVMDKNIRYFKITVYYSPLAKVHQPFVNIPNVRRG